MSETREWLTLQEVAEVLQVTDRHVRKLVARGQLRAATISSRVRRVSRYALEEFLAAERAVRNESIVVTVLNESGNRSSDRLMAKAARIAQKRQWFVISPSKTTKPRRAVPARRRFQVLQRDNFTCQYCGATPPGAVLHVDHKVPVVMGGTNDTGNLITACSDCNLGKAHMPLADTSEVNA
jgi:excisionase family DNA binding protein